MRIALVALLVAATAQAQEHEHGDGPAFHGFVNAIHDHQGGPRGDDKDFSNSMVMAGMAFPWAAGKLQLEGMLSLDPLMGRGGYPLLFQAGETANGRQHLLDRQHPHDFFMNLSATYRQP